MFNPPMRRQRLVSAVILTLVAFPAVRAESDSSYAYPHYDDNSVDRDLGKPIPSEPEAMPSERPQIEIGRPSQTPAPNAEPAAEAPAVAEPAPQAEAPAPEPTPEAAAVVEPETPALTEQAALPPPPTMKDYKVWIWQENGDCLWRIAQKVYGDKSKWKLIYLANRDVIKDPNKVYPKQKLKIPPADWQP